MVTVLHHGLPCMTEFAASRKGEGLEDDPRSGQPASPLTEEKINAVQVTVEENRRIKVYVIAETLDIHFLAFYPDFAFHTEREARSEQARFVLVGYLKRCAHIRRIRGQITVWIF